MMVSTGMSLCILNPHFTMFVLGATNFFIIQLNFVAGVPRIVLLRCIVVMDDEDEGFIYSARIEAHAKKCYGSAGHLLITGGLPVRGHSAEDCFNLVVEVNLEVSLSFPNCV